MRREKLITLSALKRPLVMYIYLVLYSYKMCNSFLWYNSRNRALAASFFRFLDHTQLDTHTPCMTPLNKWSARLRGRYLHNKHNKHPCLQRGFEPAIPVIKRPQTYALDRTATRIGYLLKLLGRIVQHWVVKNSYVIFVWRTSWWEITSETLHSLNRASWYTS